MEKLWPALQRVNSSSGALGTAVYNAMDVLVDVVIKAPADEKTRGKWLERLWDAFNEDGVGFLDKLGEHWGDVCGSAQTASRWADEFLPNSGARLEEAHQRILKQFGPNRTLHPSVLPAYPENRHHPH